MKYAKDLMTPNPKFIQSGSEIRDAVAFFLEREIHTSPVVTPVGELVGLLTELGLIKSYLRHYLDADKHEKVAHHIDLLDKPHFVEEDASLGEVIKTMLKAPSHRILVMNKQSRMVGIISPRDILRVLVGEMKIQTSVREELRMSKEKIEELAREVKDLRAMLDKYKNLFQDTPYMMHSVDAEGRIIMANKKLHETLGYQADELIGQTIFSIYPPDVHHEAAQGLEKIKKEGFHHQTYTSMIKKDGAKIRVDLASSALRGANKEFIGTITISRTVDSESLLRALNGIMDTDSAAKLQDN